MLAWHMFAPTMEINLLKMYTDVVNIIRNTPLKYMHSITAAAKFHEESIK